MDTVRGRRARDDYPLMVLRWRGDMATVDSRIEQHEAMCDEIDRLRDLRDRLWKLANDEAERQP